MIEKDVEDFIFKRERNINKLLYFLNLKLVQECFLCTDNEWKFSEKISFQSTVSSG